MVSKQGGENEPEKLILKPDEPRQIFQLYQSSSGFLDGTEEITELLSFHFQKPTTIYLLDAQ